MSHRNNPLLGAAFKMQFATLVLFFVSGLCAIGYQLSWVKLFATGLGHELPATFAVVTAFFGGLTVGARLLDRIGASRQPVRWYFALESVIFLWAFATLWLVDPTIDLVHSLLGPDASPRLYWVVAFVTTLFALLPATVAMGGTLAAAENWYRQTTAAPDPIGIVYLLNTVGAAAGAMIVPFLLMPRLGFFGTMHVLLALNGFVVIVACVVSFSSAMAPSVSTTNELKPPARRDRVLAARLLLAGFLGIGFEVLGVRIMAQIFEGTIYSFSATLCIFLAGSAIGGLLFHLVRERWNARQRHTWFVVGLSLSIVLGVGVLSRAQPLYRIARGYFGDTPLGVLGAELTLAVPVYGLACVLMGALFCHFAAQARTQAGGIGWALSANTLGGMIAPAIIALIAIPYLGLKWTGVALAFGYLALLPRPLPVARWVPLLPLAAAWLLPADIQLVTLRKGEEIVAYHDGRVASIAVTERGSERNLRVDNRFQMGGTGATALRIQRMQAHLPLLLHNDPQRALFLGVATGITSGAALAHDGLTIDAVELTPGVLAALPAFRQHNRNVRKSNRTKLYIADARRFVRMSDNQYDVIVGDLFQPARDGAGFLYTKEHFLAVRERLAADGLFCQWLPIYQMDLEVVRTVVRTFVDSYPHTQAWLGTFGVKYPVMALIGSEKPQFHDLENLTKRMSQDRIKRDLARAAIRNPVQLFGHHLADDETLRAFANGARLNTDAFPWVLFEAPRFTFHRGQPGHTTLMPLLDVFGAEVLSGVAFEGHQNGLLDDARIFAAARNDYLRGEAALALRNNDAGIEYLFAALDKSREFTLAHAQLINIARKLAQTDSKKAEAILARLSTFNRGVPTSR